MSKGAQTKKIEELIKSWQADFPKEKYIVRGQSKVYGQESGENKISSSLYRHAKKEKGRAITAQELLERERELAASTRIRGLPLIKDAEILSDLQHFGGLTNCIDFTRNIYIALFFACAEGGKRREPGELIFLPHNGMRLILPQDFKLPARASTNPQMEMLVPSVTEMDKNRPLYQDSLFVRHRSGTFNVPSRWVKQVEWGHMKIIKSILSECNVFHHSLFNDTLGLTNHSTRPVQGNLRDWTAMFNPDDWRSDSLQSILQQGTMHYCSTNYQKAIQIFGQVILGGLSDKGHRLRGSAHLCNRDYREALEDINNVSKAVWNDRDHFLKAVAYHGMGDFENSLGSINSAINFNPYRTIYHHFRIMLRQLVAKGFSDRPPGLKYLDRFVEDPDVKRIISEKIIYPQKSTKTG